MSKSITLQEFFRPEIKPVKGCKDYQEEKILLERVDIILRKSGVEALFVKRSMERYDRSSPEASEHLRHGHAVQSVRALRCTVLKGLLGESYRGLSKLLAHSVLYREFCYIEDFIEVRVPGKSTLQDYAVWLPVETMGEVLGKLTRCLQDEEKAKEIGLENELDMTVAWVDSTCLKACVHFPCDWVLMRDAVRSLVKSIVVIRKHGLKHRIGAPEDFLRQVNGLAMGMSGASRRKAGGKKERKAIVRGIKKVSQTVESHARRYRKLLDERWSESDLSRKQAEVVLRRMDLVLEQLPEARRQAHERIIGGRQVANKDKILSLYEEDIHVVVRGKAGAEVEFGNSLLVVENAGGFILYHELKKDASRGDSQWLLACYEKIESAGNGKLKAVVADRGFESRATREKLKEKGVFNGLCPRNVAELSERLQNEEDFARMLKRRGQTEARVGILKNVFLDGTPRAKGFENRQMQVAWAVLSHNLWVVARLPWVKEESEESEKLLAA